MDSSRLAVRWEPLRPLQEEDHKYLFFKRSAGVNFYLKLHQFQPLKGGKCEVHVCAWVGVLNSRRRVFGFGPLFGIRIAADRFLKLYASLTGASKPGTSRL